MTMITPSYLGETIEYSSLHACRSTLEDPNLESISLRTRKRLRPNGLRNGTMTRVAHLLANFARRFEFSGEHMDRFAIFATLDARPGKEREVEAILKSAQALVAQEVGTKTWFAFRAGPATFGIFDTFASDDGLQVHLNGEIAKALFGSSRRVVRQAAPDSATGYICSETVRRPISALRLRISQGKSSAFIEVSQHTHDRAVSRSSRCVCDKAPQSDVSIRFGVFPEIGLFSTCTNPF